jgi:hypothetical protein
MTTFSLLLSEEQRGRETTGGLPRHCSAVQNALRTRVTADGHKGAKR